MPIRPAVPNDIHAMMAIEQSAATAAHWSRRQYAQVFIDAYSHINTKSATPEAAMQSRLALILEDQANMQGFLIARCLETEWEIENIIIADRVQRQGWGTRLLGTFLNLARKRGAKSVFLEVRESNSAARRLYEKWALVENGRRKNYYTNPNEDALIYHLSFP